MMEAAELLTPRRQSDRCGRATVGRRHRGMTGSEIILVVVILDCVDCPSNVLPPVTEEEAVHDHS